MARRCGIPTPGTAQGPSIATDQVRGYARFIQKHQFRQIAGFLPGLPLLTGPDDILALLFTGDQRFFYSDSPACAG
jgi:hypothetical protein